MCFGDDTRTLSKKAVLAAMALVGVVCLAFSATAAAQTVSPHGGYSTSTAATGGTDYCLTCHDVHEAQGDYVLMRKATVTSVCNTCHGLFGATQGTGGSGGAVPVWSGKTNFTGTDPTASNKSAYKYDMSGMATPAQLDAVPGHSLGVMLNGISGVDPADPSNPPGANDIPGGSSTLKVIQSDLYYYNGLYNGIDRPLAASAYTSTGGLYCASCHTAHGNFGKMITGSPNLSSKPNHQTATVTNEKAFCLACHNLRASSAGTSAPHNHPDSLCLTCHGNEASDVAGAVNDFPHSSVIKRILTKEPDMLCTGCHTSGSLP